MQGARGVVQMMWRRWWGSAFVKREAGWGPKRETEPPWLGFVCAGGNCNGGRCGEVVGWRV
jgi:hypothetical protein